MSVPQQVTNQEQGQSAVRQLSPVHLQDPCLAALPSHTLEAPSNVEQLHLSRLVEYPAIAAAAAAAAAELGALRPALIASQPMTTVV